MQENNQYSELKPLEFGSVFNTIVRVIGIIIMIVGLVILGKVLHRVWSLYDDPGYVKTYSEKIEEASNINANFNAGFQRFLKSTMKSRRKLKEFNLAYFCTWLLILLLLGIIGRIGIAMISQGGKLAIVGTAEKHIAKEVSTEIARVLGEMHMEKQVLEKVSENVISRLQN